VTWQLLDAVSAFRGGRWTLQGQREGAAKENGVFDLTVRQGGISQDFAAVSLSPSRLSPPFLLQEPGTTVANGLAATFADFSLSNHDAL
jgi:hypothetical protein